MGRPLSTVLVFLCLVPLARHASAEPVQLVELPRVRLIATGGTISNRPGGRVTAAELVQSVPALDRYVRAETEQFANLTSSALTIDQFLQLARRINELFERRPDLAGIVVSSGTDTLEELAYFFNLTIKSDRPVVIVGSMRTPETPGFDGTANLLQAFRVAGDPASRGRGVLVVLNHEINSAREVTKTNAQALETFETREYGLLGVVDPDRIVYYRRLDRRHTFASEFDVSKIEALPRVDILMVYQDAPGDLMRAAMDAGAKGLVIATAGAGAISSNQREAVIQALNRGVIVVLATRTGSGRVPPRLPGSADEDEAGTNFWSPNRIAGEDLAPLKARILLMLALTRTRDGRDIQRMFTEY